MRSGPSYPVIQRNPQQKFTYSAILTIPALGTTSQAKQLLFDEPFGILKGVCTVYCLDAGGKSQAVTATSAARDPVELYMRKENGEVFFSDPIDVFAFNEEFNTNLGFAGWLVPGGTKLTLSATHKPVGTSAFPSAPIVIYVAFSGYKQ